MAGEPLVRGASVETVQDGRKTTLVYHRCVDDGYDGACPACEITTLRAALAEYQAFVGEIAAWGNGIAHQPRCACLSCRARALLAGTVTQRTGWEPQGCPMPGACSCIQEAETSALAPPAQEASRANPRVALLEHDEREGICRPDEEA